MRTTLNIDDNLLVEAQRLTGMAEKTALVQEGLRALIGRESARRLAGWAALSRSFARSLAGRRNQDDFWGDTWVWIDHLRAGGQIKGVNRWHG